MNRSSTDLPERLLAADATDFERRLLEAALRRGRRQGRRPASPGRSA